MTALTIQCAWSNRRGMSRFAASVDAAENPGIMSHGDSMHPVSGSNRDGKAPGRLWPRIAVATLCLPVHACDLGSGGAVELSWSLRPASSAGQDKFAPCVGQDSKGNNTWVIDKIRLHWQPAAGGETGSLAWNCGDNHGTTGFEVSLGLTNLWVTPDCAPPMTMQSDDSDIAAAPDTYIAPAIVQRKVIRGQTVTLGAVELVISTSTCPLPTSCVCPTMTQVATDHTVR
ncbi:MAG TPA: hypothetical protein VHW23_10810 [Kofleriaceae bacterium]|nr:hypothetical protein [Kofleriaceae bacterium]